MKRMMPRLDGRGGEAWLAILLVAPACSWLAATLLYPLAVSVSLSFQDVKIIGSPGAYVAFANFERVASNAAFWSSIGRSAIWVAGNAAVQTPLALLTAILLAD
jgi:multiple sugar transport system permease protein